MKKLISILVCAAVLTLCLAATAAGAERTIAVSVGGKALDTAQPARLVGNTTYVPLYKFCSLFSSAGKSFDDATKTAKITCRGIDIYAKSGERFICANGRYFYSGEKNLIIDSTMYVPIRAAAKAFEADVIWNGKTYSTTVNDNGGTATSGDKFYNSADLLWLSRIIYAESNTEPFEGKIAVGNVVLNRVRSEEFPNTVYGVIFDRKYGTQFTPVANGTIYNTPTEMCVIAAKICLDGYTLSDSVLYFMDAEAASTMWIANNRKFAFLIGKHSFYY